MKSEVYLQLGGTTREDDAPLETTYRGSLTSGEVLTC